MRSSWFVYSLELLFQTLHSFLIYLPLLFAYGRRVFALIAAIQFFNLLLEKQKRFVAARFFQRYPRAINFLAAIFAFLDIQDLQIAFWGQMYTLHPFFQTHNLLQFCHFYLIVFFFINTISRNEHFLLVVTFDSSQDFNPCSINHLRK